MIGLGLLAVRFLPFGCPSPCRLICSNAITLLQDMHSLLLITPVVFSHLEVLPQHSSTHYQLSHNQVLSFSFQLQQHLILLHFYLSIIAFMNSIFFLLPALSLISLLHLEAFCSLSNLSLFFFLCRLSIYLFWLFSLSSI